MINKDLSRFYPDNLEGSSEFMRREEVNELANSHIKSISHPSYRGFEIEYETGLKALLPIRGGTGMSVDMDSTQTYIQIALDKNYQHLGAHMIAISHDAQIYFIYLISQSITPCTTLDNIMYAQGEYGLDVNGYVFYYDDAAEGAPLKMATYSFGESSGESGEYETFISIGSTTFTDNECTITDRVAQCY